MHDADDLRDHAAHRRADDVRRRDAFGVEHGQRVVRHLLERVGPRRGAGVPDTAVVGREAPVVPAEGHALEGPAAGVGAEALDQENRRAVSAAPDVVEDLDAVVGGDLLHRSLRLLTANIRSRQYTENLPDGNVGEWLSVPTGTSQALAVLQPERRALSSRRLTAARVRSASSAPARVSPGTASVAVSTTGPMITRHGRIGSGPGPPGRTAAGTTG